MQYSFKFLNEKFSWHSKIRKFLETLILRFKDVKSNEFNWIVLSFYDRSECWNNFFLRRLIIPWWLIRDYSRLKCVGVAKCARVAPPRNRLTPLPGILQTSHEYEPVISWVNRTRWIWWWPSKLIIVNRNRDIAIFTGFSVICYMTS